MSSNGLFSATKRSWLTLRNTGSSKNHTTVSPQVNVSGFKISDRYPCAEWPVYFFDNAWSPDAKKRCAWALSLILQDPLCVFQKFKFSLVRILRIVTRHDSMAGEMARICISDNFVSSHLCNVERHAHSTLS